MPRFAAKMKPGATLIMSGFYQQDVPMLTERAESLGLTTVATVNDGEWTCVLSVLSSHFSVLKKGLSLF
jgi:ribosomal protein L11 methyltransferase